MHSVVPLVLCRSRKSLLAGLAALPLLAGAFVPAWATSVEYHRPVDAAPTMEDIGGGYTTPEVQRPIPQPAWWWGVDVGLLIAGLGLSAWLGLYKRSRRGIALLTIGSLIYFGIYRQGCVCPIGAIQNVVVALVDRAYNIPVVVVIFFFLPLVAALLFGRVFCGGVCPLGAIADLVLLRPVQVPRWVDRILGSLKYIYLVLAIWFVVRPGEQREFLICRFDPFVGFFRMNGPGEILIFGGILLLLGMFIGRPYCRYLCPYGAILAVLSRFAWRGVTITPGQELDCGLCVTACPFGAIKKMRAERAACLSCGRCYASCPVVHVEEKNGTAR